MPTYTQDNRQIAILTPLGKDVLLLQGFTGREGISELFHFELDLLAEVDRPIAADQVVGAGATLRLKTASGERFFHGVINRFTEGASDAVFTSFRAELVPWLWLLTQTADCRIFQEMKVPDIITKIFTDLGFKDYRLNLTRSYPVREYCVQYRETDFNFVARLMEQYGIFYYFEHENGKHTLVLADTPAAHQPCPNQPRARFQSAIGAGVNIPDDVVTAWDVEHRFRAGKWAMTDYNFETPSVNLAVQVESVHPAPGGMKLEIYDYPGEYLKRAEGEFLARTRIEEEEWPRLLADGGGNCGAFTPGFKFDLTEHPRKGHNGTYVLTNVRHSAVESDYRAEAGTAGFDYGNRFTCLPGGVPYRPRRTTPRPVVEGVQTAEVVGPPGEEIYTDKFGRVKVQFHWDREGQKNEKSSCWIRVSHPWAGKSWGAVAIPRLGQEVVVDFLEGDPDQPLVVGRVYNGEVMPPYPLPAGGVVSGIKSNSTKGGGGYNEISMDDTKGKEKITIHGQYDMGTTIEHDDTQSVKNNRLITVDGTHTETVKKSIAVTSSDANYHLTTKTEIVLEVGASKITMKADGTINIEGINISVTGVAVAVDGSANVSIHGMTVTSQADATNEIKGAMVMSEGSAVNTVKGGMVMLNP
jgi:type VI secretion system secreted protein VgrG